jgi:hypothetical protein
MVTRKLTTDKKKEKPAVESPPARKFDPKRSFSLLEDAVKDGQFLGKLGTELVVEKFRDGKRMRTICLVKGINGTKIDTYDLTIGHWFTFDCENLEKYEVVVKFNDPNELKK